ncbi:MAG: ribosome maturation factor RimM [Bacillota bacterium]|nr:ribosome maturation factor RimM [Bacillota bacterium]
MQKQFLEIGKIVSTHGLRGEMRVEAWCDSPEFLCQFKTLYFNNGKDCLKIKQARPHKNIVIILADGIETVQQADMMRGKVLYMNRDEIKLSEETFFVQDIIGLSVIDADTQAVYGKVSDVLKTGANDVYEVMAPDGKKYYIPAIPDVIISTDIEKEELIIRPLKGIFDDED